MVNPSRFYSRLVGNQGAKKRISPLLIRKTEPTTPTSTPQIPSNYLVQVKLPSYKNTSSSSTLTPTMGAASVLMHNALLVGRQLEMLNVFLGYEQANKYSIKDYQGLDVGYIAEQDNSIKSTLLRQFLRTRRAFHASVLDRAGNVVLDIKRPIKWFLNSTISVSTPEGKEIGHVESDWHLWRRRYNVFVGLNQVARIDNGLWAWDFDALSENKRPLSTINRNFSGFIKEIFTDAGQYVVHYDATLDQERPLSLDERAVLLAAAVTIDIDFFSRHSQNHSSGLLPMGGMGMPMPMPVPIPGSGDVASTTDTPPLGDVGPTTLGGFGSSSSSSDIPSSTSTTSTNQWGDDAFLSDEEAGISSEAGDSGGSVFKDIWDAFNED